MTNNILNLYNYKLQRNKMMIDLFSKMAHKDIDLFMMEAKTTLEFHVINSAYYQGLHEALLTYAPDDFKPKYGETQRLEISVRVTDLESFIDSYPELYQRLTTLWRRARSASIQAVTDRWIETNPTMYIDFTNSGKSLKEFMKTK